MEQAILTVQRRLVSRFSWTGSPGLPGHGAQGPLGHQLCIAVFLGGSGDKTETQGRESLALRASDHLLLMCCQVLFPVGLGGFTNNTVHKLAQ